MSVSSAVVTMDVAAGALAIVVVVAAVVAVLVVRRGARRDEIHSVEGYRHRLGSIEQLSHRGIRAVRVLDEAGAPPASAPPAAHRASSGVVPATVVPVPMAAPAAPPLAGAGRPVGAIAGGAMAGTPTAGSEIAGTEIAGTEIAGTEIAGNGAHVHDVVSSGSTGHAAPVAAAGVLPPTTTRGGRRQLDAMNRRAPRLAGPLLVVVILLAALGGLIYLGVQTEHGHPAAARHHSSSGSAPRHHAGGHAEPTPTSTTVPASYEPVTSSASTATYAAPQTSYTLVVAATSGTCWISVTGPNGTTPFSGLLVQGTTKSFKLTGDSTLVLGAPWATTITLDHAPLALPAGASSPFVVTLVPSA